jgi:CBS domain-containing protein/sporulation protein YlmC with PRC-barrel domain
MADNTSVTKNHTEEVFFLSEIVRAKAFVRGKKIGTLSDLVIVENGKLPEVTQVCVARPFGDPSLLVPWPKVASLTAKEVHLDIEEVKQYEGEPVPDAVLLKDHILDKKVLDTEGREVEVVYDIKLALRNNKLYVTDVDLSKYALLRRMGLKGIANFLSNLGEKIRKQVISWTYIQPLPTQISSFKGDVRLKTLKDKLEDMHPVDLADILEEMEHKQRVAVFNELDANKASDILEEIEPTVQRDLVSSLKKEKVAQLVDQMTPGQAADILSILPLEEANAVVKLLSPENASKVQTILERQEEQIVNFCTLDVLKFAPAVTVEQTLDEYHRTAKEKDVIMYIYVVDENEKLVGVLDIRELLQANDKEILKNVMVPDVISLKANSTLKEAQEMFARYDFRAIPITDDNDKFLGVLPYRDMKTIRQAFGEYIE